MQTSQRAFLIAFASVLAAQPSFADPPGDSSPAATSPTRQPDPAGTHPAAPPAQRILASEASPPSPPPADVDVSRGSLTMAEPNGEYLRTPAFEVNVLWPFFPGGIVDLKALFPVVRADRRDFRGEIIGGVHSDFGWGPAIRPVDNYGKVSILAGKVGYRQFFVYGTHLDVSVNLGWRHEEENIYDGGRLDAFVGRLWMFAGYQHELSTRVYLNLRGGGGVHLFRTDRFADKERKFAPAGDVNLGVRF